MEKQLSHLIPGVVSFLFKTGHNICSLFFTWQILAMTEVIDGKLLNVS